MNNEEIKKEFIKKVNNKAGVSKIYEDNLFELLLAENFGKVGLLKNIKKLDTTEKFKLYLLSTYIDRSKNNKQNFDYKKSIKTIEKALGKTIIDDNITFYNLEYLINSNKQSLKKAYDKFLEENTIKDDKTISKKLVESLELKEDFLKAYNITIKEE